MNKKQLIVICIIILSICFMEGFLVKHIPRGLLINSIGVPMMLIGAFLIYIFGDKKK